MVGFCITGRAAGTSAPTTLGVPQPFFFLPNLWDFVLEKKVQNLHDVRKKFSDVSVFFSKGATNQGSSAWRTQPRATPWRPCCRDRAPRLLSASIRPLTSRTLFFIPFKSSDPTLFLIPLKFYDPKISLFMPLLIDSKTPRNIYGCRFFFLPRTWPKCHDMSL